MLKLGQTPPVLQRNLEMGLRSLAWSLLVFVWVDSASAQESVASQEEVSGQETSSVQVEKPVIDASQALREPIDLTQGCVTAECHAPLVAEEFVHFPDCVDCHDLEDEATHLFSLNSGSPDLCYACHDEPEGAQYIHGPVAHGDCMVCHDPHSSSMEYLLEEKGNDHCFACHTEMHEHVTLSSYQHGTEKEVGCVKCHDVHWENQEFLLKSDVPTLCVECHTEVGEIVEHATVAHEPLNSDKKCLNCHNPHGSNEPKMLADKQVNQCLECHSEPMETELGVLGDMKTWMAENPVHHGPIEEGNCAACHNPHGSQHFRMLAQAYPKKFYNKFDVENFALCWECHEQTLALEERTATLTGFRNGEDNMHFLHVNRQKGRSCRACHEMHAGTKPLQMKDKVPFGKWVFDLNFEKTETGGSCAPGCHEQLAYDRIEAIPRERPGKKQPTPEVVPAAAPESPAPESSPEAVPVASATPSVAASKAQ